MSSRRRQPELQGRNRFSLAAATLVVAGALVVSSVACSDTNEKEPGASAGGSGGTESAPGGAESDSGDAESGSGGTANVAEDSGAPTMVAGGTEAGSGSAEGGAAGAGNDAGTSKSLYAVMYEIYDDTGSASYLSLLDSLELDEVDLSQALEFGGGRAFIQTYGGKLFVGDAESPTVTRYSVTEDGELIAEGRLSFANYGLSSGQFDAWNVTFISPAKAYLLDFRDGTTIIWNPSTMEIVGDIPPADEFHRAGYSFESTPGALRDGKLFRTVSWVNYDDAEYSSDFFLAIYDLGTDELLELIEETRCPVPGNLVHHDEAGNIYFSNWVWPVAGAILRGAPSPCVLRIQPDQERFDPDWVLDYRNVAEGRHGAMFSYMGDGRALMSVFYDERTSFDATTDPWSYVGSNNWRIWSLDFQSQAGAPLEGIDFNAGAFTPLRFGDRLYLLVPGGEADNWATQLYEVTGDSAVPRVKLPGWSYQLVKLR
jgi:hypothetical protein